ncbi:MAG TPA: zinc-finger domain-containing protein [Aquabacterium sp.]|uniref:zinc-finger domain-containing protein n=1 Tax=Aquabacterium sp. TaxID=1872578 RepID=UPI002E316B25|nr:zinc-finger domain-containing protein [Aquabacterium sp.]HEX5371355.1 zinc-finger domain-containing protein [Aquabacterium sp.]
MSNNTSQAKAVVEVVAGDLQGPGVVFCPNPKQQLWSQHPKVYIDVASTGEGKCPYCGTVYQLKAGEKVGHGH